VIPLLALSPGLTHALTILIWILIAAFCIWAIVVVGTIVLGLVLAIVANRSATPKYRKRK